ncbi:MAG: hypothetical protein A2145_04845 [candidate division Zixibacteria bacterium RBG_16_40_9]|nr:MAG: hypothetical protein A2145_04845 [candidate division Zixibacteria bacterium RBG_16_40_9]
MEITNNLNGNSEKEISTSLVDLHSHILWGIDDGAQSQKQSLEMAQQAWEYGIGKICATPHLPLENRENFFQKAKQILKETEGLIRGQNLNIQLYMGFEIALDYSLISDKNLSNYTLNQNGKHLLCELPFGTSLKLAEKLFYPLRLDGFIPILAHAERFISSESEIQDLKRLTDLGVLLQVNAASLVGIAGNKTKKIAEILIKSNLAHLVASDAHDQKVRSYLPVSLAYSYCGKLVGEEKTKELFETNPGLILGDQTIEEKTLLAGIKKESF